MRELMARLYSSPPYLRRRKTTNLTLYWRPRYIPVMVDPFRYGWRPRYVRLPDGEVIEEQIPLTAEDLLDPQDGDVVGQSAYHFSLLLRLAILLRRYYADQKDVFVAGDLKMLWRIPGLKNPAPDVAVIPGVRDREADRKSFDVVAEGTRPWLVIELVSSTDEETRNNDRYSA